MSEHAVVYERCYYGPQTQRTLVSLHDTEEDAVAEMARLKADDGNGESLRLEHNEYSRGYAVYPVVEVYDGISPLDDHTCLPAVLTDGVDDEITSSEDIDRLAQERGYDLLVDPEDADTLVLIKTA